MRRRVLRAVGMLPGMLGARFAFIVVRDQLDEGTVTGAESLSARLLRHADLALERADLAAAADPASKALHVVFHPARAARIAPRRTRDEDHRRLAPLEGSRAAQVLTSSTTVTIPTTAEDDDHSGCDAQSRCEPAASVSTSGPERAVRVLVAGHRNLLFADRLIEALQSVPGLSIRRIDLSDLGLDEDVRLHPLTLARLRAVIDGVRIKPPQELADAIAESDVVLSEWGNHSTAYLSLLEGVGAVHGGVPLVSRVHRFEIDTAYFHLIDLASVDQWLFIAGHIRDRALRLREIAPDRTHVVRNINDLSRFSDEKKPGAERTLIHTDWSREAKDAGFAFEVLSLLRTQDPTWRLLLAGTQPSPSSGYGKRMLDLAAQFGDAVEVLGHCANMPEVFKRAGFVLSTSRAEGSHEVVAEGAAAACVPVVRDWPENREDGGAASVYPSAWVVTDPEEAARRVQAHADIDGWRREGQRARDLMLQQRDPSRVTEQYASVLREQTQRG